MKLHFLGTRANIESRTRLHNRHACLLVSYYHRKVMIDCGEDWLDRIESVNPDAIVLTHAHPDHAWGLKAGAPCPVYATTETAKEIRSFPLNDIRTIDLEKAFDIGKLRFIAFGVEHSTIAPAVGYRIRAGAAVVFYAPDLVYIHEREAALEKVDIYIGDGATLTRSFVRKRDEHLIGHTPLRTQLTWCRKTNVPRAFFTHCGSEIVDGDERTVGAQIREMAKERGVEAEIATDGKIVYL